LTKSSRSGTIRIVSRKTVLVTTAVGIGFFIALIVLAAMSNAYAMPDAKHGPMELFGLGPELFAERAIAWVKGLSAIVKEAISELGIIAAAIILFVQNVRRAKDAREMDEKIDQAKREISQRLSAHGEQIHAMALATNPGSMPVEEIKGPTVIAPAPGATPGS
jgi:hypothetical protein